MKYLLDTNPIIDALNHGYSLKNHDYIISEITEMELLSFSELSEDEEKSIRNLLSLFEIRNLSSDIKEKAIQIRKKYKIKLPDSIIAATAILVNAKLVTADKQLTKINEIEIVPIEIIID